VPAEAARSAASLDVLRPVRCANCFSIAPNIFVRLSPSILSIVNVLSPGAAGDFSGPERDCVVRRRKRRQR
jgi:hypothetical protein